MTKTKTTTEKKTSTTVKTKFIVKRFPKNTAEIYLTGSTESLGNWLPEEAIKMQYYQNDGTDEMFVAVVDLPKNTEVEYKYINHPTWSNVECGIVAEELPNRKITLKNTKTREIIDEVKGFRIWYELQGSLLRESQANYW